MSIIPGRTRCAEVLGNTPILRLAGRGKNRSFFPHGVVHLPFRPEFLAFWVGAPHGWNSPETAPALGSPYCGNSGNAQSFH